MDLTGHRNNYTVMYMYAGTTNIKRQQIYYYIFKQQIYAFIVQAYRMGFTIKRISK